MLSYANSWFHVVPTELDKATLCRLVEAYPVLIGSISKRGNKKYTEDLTSLDEYRYKELPRVLAARRDCNNDKHKMYGCLELEELKRLLEWKMFRGVYRPSLRGLIASNSPEVVRTVTSEAFAEFGLSSPGLSGDLDKHIQQSLKLLCKLRGVGPATASLILSVAYPDDVAFFADELFAWISLQDKQMLDTFLQQKHPQGVAKGIEGKRVDKIVGIKYSEGEYKTLCTAISRLKERLRSSDDEISATDIEKAAFVAIQGLEVSWTEPEDSEDTRQTSNLVSNKEQGEEKSKSRCDQGEQHESHSSSNEQNHNHKMGGRNSTGKRKSQRLQTRDESSPKQMPKRKKITPR